MDRSAAGRVKAWDDVTHAMGSANLATALHAPFKFFMVHQTLLRRNGENLWLKAVVSYWLLAVGFN